MNTLSLSKTKAAVCLTAVISMAISLIVPTLAKADLETIRSLEVARYRDAQGRNISIQYALSTQEQLAQFRPALLRQEAARMRAELTAQCKSGGGLGSRVVSFAKDFVVESSSFGMAVGFSAAQQALFEPGNDPAFARHFVEQSVLDPLAHVSFAGFMLGNRGAASLMAMTNLTFDPCKILKRRAALAANGRGALATAEELTESKFQSKFKFIAGPLAMAGGLIVSSALHEALADPNIRLCGALHIGKVRQENKEAAEKACDDAYEDWVMGSGKKIRKLVPDMLSMGAVVTILGKINKLKAGAAIAAREHEVEMAFSASQRMAGSAIDQTALRITYVQGRRAFILRGISASMRLGGWASRVVPGARFAVAIGSGWVFLGLNDIILPWIKSPWESFTSGREIGRSLNGIESEMTRLSQNGWVYTAPPVPSHCPTTPIMLGLAIAVHYEMSDCFQPSTSPAELVKRLGEQQKAWRDSLMAETSQTISNWQDYVLKFTNTYTDAQKFYRFVLNSLLYVEDGLQGDPAMEQIKNSEKLMGVPYSSSKWTTGKICDIPQETINIFNEAIATVDAAITQERRPSIVIKLKPSPLVMAEITSDSRLALTASSHYDIPQLQMIRDGLAAMNCSLRLPDQTGGLSEEQVEQLRWKKYRAAVNSIYWELRGLTDNGVWDVLHNRGIHRDSVRDVETPEYKDSIDSNAFMKINYVLGGVTPFGAGVAFIRALEHDEDVINKDHRGKKPTNLYGVDTFFMSDYLLASMVCGPMTVGETIVEKKQWDVEFHPPRVVTNVGADICKEGLASKWTMMDRVYENVAPMIGAKPMGYMDPHMSVWDLNGHRHMGFLEVLKAFKNPAITGPHYAEKNFDNWWLTTIEPTAVRRYADFRKRFVDEVLVKRFFPLLKRQDYTMDVGIINKKGLAKGLANSIVDSLNDNLKIIGEILVDPQSTPAEQLQFVAAKEKVIQHFKFALNFVGSDASVIQASRIFARMYGSQSREAVTGTLSAGAFAYFEANKKMMELSIKSLPAAINPRFKALSPRAQQNYMSVLNAALKNISDIQNEIETYHGLVTSVRLDTAG